MRIRIQLIIFDADPDFYLMRMRIRMRIQVTKMMRIFADPDPQHRSYLKEPGAGDAVLMVALPVAGWEEGGPGHHQRPLAGGGRGGGGQGRVQLGGGTRRRHIRRSEADSI